MGAAYTSADAVTPLVLRANRVVAGLDAPAATRRLSDGLREYLGTDGFVGDGGRELTDDSVGVPETVR